MREGARRENDLHLHLTNSLETSQRTDPEEIIFNAVPGMAGRVDMQQI